MDVSSRAGPSMLELNDSLTSGIEDVDLFRFVPLIIVNDQRV